MRTHIHQTHTHFHARTYTHTQQFRKGTTGGKEHFMFQQHNNDEHANPT
jgi:hypothetical protein